MYNLAKRTTFDFHFTTYPTKNDHKRISEKTFSKTHPSQADYNHQFYLERSITDFVDGLFHSVGSFTF